jgi:THO complex subunit 2
MGDQNSELLNEFSSYMDKEKSLEDLIKLIQTLETVDSQIVDIIWLLDLEERNKSLLVSLIDSLRSHNVISDSILIERLEIDLLEACAIIDSKLFLKRLARINTDTLYRQTKFNLLREESEGYSKLICTVVSHFISPIGLYWNAEKSKTLVEINELRNSHLKINVERSLRDIKSLIGYFDLDPNRVIDIVLDLFASNFKDHTDFFLLLLENSPWKPNPDPVPIVAQVLGFKYISHSQQTPYQLSLLSALLITRGIVVLEELLAHLNTTGNDYEKFIEMSKNARGRFGGVGLLDDQREADDVKIDNHVAGLVHALSAIGDLHHTRLILDHYPNLTTMYPDISYNLCRILHIQLEPVLDQLRPLKPKQKNKPEFSDFCPASYTVSPRECEIFDEITVGRNCGGKSGQNHTPNYRFFYPAWREKINQVNENEALELIEMMLNYIGPNLAEDAFMVGKIIRIGTYQIVSKPEVLNRWLSIIANYLFPALSLLPPNPGLSTQFWSLLKLLPYQTRFGLYGEWKHMSYEKFPELIRAEVGCRKDVQYIMNRLSKENVKPFGRHIGKVVHSNPTIAFSYILNAIEGYDNMIPFVVDATRYLTELDLDCLSFLMIESLSRSKPKVEKNGTTIEKWLKSLRLLKLISFFSGNLFKRHVLDLDSMLQYITNQLLADQVFDLIVLQELISQMTGISLSEALTQNQLNALSGGLQIRKESIETDNYTFLRRTTKRFVGGLLKTGLSMPLGILIAQQRKQIVFRLGMDDDPFMVPDLKVLAWGNDQCQRSFLQYFDFLMDNIGEKIFVELCPDMKTLVGVYGLAVVHAFHIQRTKMMFLRRESSKGSKPLDTKEDDQMLVDEPVFEHSSFQELFQHIESLKLANELPTGFFVTFWLTTLSDIQVPVSHYTQAINAITGQIQKLENDKQDRGASRRRREKEKLASRKQRLEDELANQNINMEQTLKRLNQESQKWFETGMKKLTRRKC